MSDAPTLGWRASEIEEELPTLQLLIGEASTAGTRSLTAGSPSAVKERLRELSNRFRGARAVAIRREPVPAAYRVFFRHIGLDPDVVRTPIEAAVLERMLRGGFLTSGLLEDVLLIALLDTGVPVWALDADRSTVSLAFAPAAKPSRSGDRLAPRCCRPAGWWWPMTPPRSRSCSARWPPTTGRTRAPAA